LLVSHHADRSETYRAHAACTLCAPMRHPSLAFHENEVGKNKS
jgi:hypothetical protein